MLLVSCSHFNGVFFDCSQYSSKLDKVFVIYSKVCPVTIRTNRSFDELRTCQLRSWVAFKREGKGAVLSPDIVERCAEHRNTALTDASKTSQGILLCDDAFDYPNYEIHHSTLIKFDKLKSSSRPALPEVTVNFKFACLSTCSSVKRKPLEWVLMLEDARWFDLSINGVSTTSDPTDRWTIVVPRMWSDFFSDWFLLYTLSQIHCPLMDHLSYVT